jgi:hypothetical protein
METEITNTYQSGKIYQITDNAYTKCYIGSTIEKYLSNRMGSHVSGYKKWKSGKRNSKTMSYELFDEFGVENCKIELIELFPCNSKKELHKREGYWIKQSECVNKFIAGQTDREYYEENKEEIHIKQKIYRTENADKVKEWFEKNAETLKEKRIKKYNDNRDDQLEKMKKFREENKDYFIKYAEEHREEKNAKGKLYYEANKDKISEKIVCECGNTYSKYHKSRHFKTKQHIEKLANGV